MAKYSNVIEYKVKTNLDDTGLRKLQQELGKVENVLQKIRTTPRDNYVAGLSQQYQEAIGTIEKVRQTINTSYNSSIKAIDVNKFNSQLAKLEVSASSVGKAFSNAGVVGQKGLNNLIARVASLDTGIKSVNTTSQKLATTLKNTVRWGLSASVFENFMSGAHEAMEYIKDLDRSLNNIRIVSGYSAEYMREFAEEANEAAVALGKSTTAYTDASLIYIQQGKTLEESKKLAELTLKTANVTGQETAEVSEQLTALMNGYQVAVDDMEASVDKLAKVAAIGASDMEELATAASRVSSTANAMGVSQDQLIAQLSTIISVTRLAPETIGNSLKTIYARLGDLKMGETLEDGVDLGSIGKVLDTIGISITDTSGELRNMGDVIEELMVKWKGLSNAEQQAVAVKLAGKYQYNNLIALLENAEMYNEQLEASETSLGTINEQQAIYLDSLEAKLGSLSSSFEGFVNSIFNVDDIKPFIDAITGMINLVSSFMEGIGGGGTFLASLSGSALKMFSGTAAKDIVRHSTNRQQQKIAQQNSAATKALIEAFGLEGASSVAENSLVYQYAKNNAPYYAQMDEEQRAEYKASLQGYAERENSRLDLEHNIDNALARVDAVEEILSLGVSPITKQEDGSFTVNSDLYKQTFKYASDTLETGEYGKAFQAVMGNIASNNITNILKRLNQQGEYLRTGNINSDEDKKNFNNAGRSIKSNIRSINKQINDVVNNGEIDSFISYDLQDKIAKFQDALANVDLGGLNTSSDKIDELTQYFTVVLEHAHALEDFTKAKATQYQTLMKEEPILGEDEIQNLSRQSSDAAYSKQADEQAQKDETERRATQKRISLYLEVAGAIQQMSAAWQAFHNLGSIWANDDLTMGEKVFQSFTNIASAAMVLVQSLKTLKEVSTALQGLDILTTGSSVLKDSGLFTNLAKKLAGGLTSALLKIPALIPAGALITIGTSLVFGIIDGIKQAEKQARADRMEEYETSEQKYNETSSQYSEFVSLKKEYDETGEATDAFTQSLDALGETLDIAGKSALLATNQYDKLSESIQRNIKLENSRQLAEAKQYQEDVAAENKDAVEELNNYLNSWKVSDDVSVADSAYKQYRSEMEAKADDAARLALENDVAPYLDVSDGNVKVVGTVLLNITDPIPVSASDLVTIAIEKGLQIDLQGNIILDSDKILTPEQFAAYYSQHIQLTNADGQTTYITLLDLLNCKTDEEFRELLVGQEYITLVNPEDGEQVNVPITDIVSPTQIQAALENADITNLSTEGFVDLCNAIWTRASDTVSAQIDGTTILAKTDEGGNIASVIDLAAVQDVIIAKAMDGINLAEADGELTQAEYNAAVLSALDAVLEPLGFSSDDLPDEVIQQIKDGYAGAASGESDALSTTFAKAITGAIDEVDISVFTTVKNTLQNCVDAVGNWLNGVADTASGVASDASYWVSQTLDGGNETYSSAGATGVAIGYTDATSGFLQPGATLSDEEYNNVYEFYKQLYDINSKETYKLSGYISEGFINGFTSGDFSSLKELIIEKYGQEVYDGLAWFWEVHSPSRKAMRLAGYIVEGGIQGAEEQSDALVDALVSPYEEASDQISDVEFKAPEIADTVYDYGALGDISFANAFNKIYADTGVSSIANGIDTSSSEGLADAHHIVNGLAAYAEGLQDYIDTLSPNTEEWNKYSSILAGVNAQLETLQGKLKDVEAVTDAMISVGQLALSNLSLSTDLSGQSSLETYNYITGDAFTKAAGFTWDDFIATMGGNEADALASLSPYLYGVDTDALANQATMAQFDKSQGTYTDDMSPEAQSQRSSVQLLMAGANTNVDPDVYTQAVMRLMTASNNGTIADTEAMFGNFNSVVSNMDNIPSAIADHIIGSISADDLANEDTIKAALTDAYREYFENDMRSERDAAITQNDERREATHTIAKEGLTDESALGLLPSNISELFEDASGRSDAFSDSVSLLSNNTFEAKRDLLELDNAIEGMDYAAQEKSIAEINAQIAELSSKSAAEINIELGTNFSSDDIDDMIEDLQDEVEAQEFTLDVDIAGDLIDQTDGLIDAMGDVRNAASLIGEGFVVSADDLSTVLDIFPDLVNGLQILEDGSAQVNQEILQGVLDTTSASVQASAEEQATKLENLGNYATAMSEMYQQQATAYAMLCDTNTDNDEQANQLMVDMAAETEQIKNTYKIGEDEAAQTLATNEGNYAADASGDIAGAMAEADSSVAGSLSNMTSNAGSAFYDIASKAVQMAQTIATALSNPEGASNLVSSGGISLSGSGSTYSYEASISAGQTIDIGGEKYTVGSKEGQTDYAADAQRYQALADAYKNMAATLFSQSSALRANMGSTLSDFGNVGSGSGSSGSGGSGSGSEYEPKTKEYQEDEIDRYEKVDTLLDAITADYEKLNSEQERLIGMDLADNITEQIYLLRQQIDLQKEKLGIQKEEAEEYRKELADRFGVQFNDDGFITNYAEKYKEILGTLNALITEYNNTTTEEGQEALEEQIDFAQETYDDFVDLIDKYDEMISSTIKDTEQQLEDLEDEIEDLNISMFQKAVEATDNIKDLNEALIDFNAVFSGLNSDNPFREMETSAKKLAGYFDVATDSANDYYDTLAERYRELMGREGVSDSQKSFFQQQIAQLEEARKAAGQGTMEQFGTGYLDLSMMSVASIAEQIRQFEETGVSEIFGKNSADLYDTAKEVFAQATDLVADYEGEIDSLRGAIVDAIDDIAERMEERKEQYEAITDALEHQASIIQLIHGEEAYEKLNQVLAAQQYTYKQQIAESQQQIEYWQDLLQYMEEGSEEYRTIQEQITDTQSTLNDLIETSLENLQQQYTNIVNKITDQWAFSAMGNDLDWIAQEWELINRNADYYLDDVNAAYNIQKLQADYLDLLDDATSLDVQQKITEQMNEQLGYLREKEKLSEYDVAYAQAQLEILQRQIALQEAQANKSQMKLRRDSQGNYSYVYTANEDDVKSAQSDLLDAQNNAYNLSKDQMKDTQNDSISALQEAQDLINNLWTNANLTLDQKKERTQTIIDSLKEYLAGTSEQLSTSEKNIINDFIGMAEILTDENKNRMDDVYQEIINGNQDAFDQIDTRWSTSITAWLNNMEQFNDSTDDMFADLVNNADDYQSQIDDIADLVKQDFDDMSESIQNCVDKTNDLALSNADFINQLKEDSGVIREYEERLQDYASRIADTENAMRSYQTQVNELQGQLVAKEQENSNLTGQIQDLYNQINPGGANGSGLAGGDGSGVIGSGGAAGYGTSDMALGIAQNIWTYGVSGGWGNNPIRSSKLTNSYGIDFASTVQGIINTRVAQGREGELVNFDSQKFSSYNLVGYDTGGYTGDWGDSSGKLALLHTKELVLNQGDTDNILQAVQAVRTMTSELKTDGINKIVDFFSQQSGKVGTSSDTVEQEVHITATFPNATSVEDIREAILGLSGQVVQYAHRK